MSQDNPWNWQARYTEPPADGDLAQGDLIDTKKGDLGGRFKRARFFVVLNQSCDLARQQLFEKTSLMVPKARTLLVAPAVPLREYFASDINNGKSLANSSRLERLLWWNDDWAVYLPPGPGFELDLVVVLEELYTLEAWRKADGQPDLGGYEEVLRARVLGLTSPWAERLGWMVGRQFARVGTPDPPMHQRPDLVAKVAARLTAAESG